MNVRRVAIVLFAAVCLVWRLPQGLGQEAAVDDRASRFYEWVENFHLIEFTLNAADNMALQRQLELTDEQVHEIRAVLRRYSDLLRDQNAFLKKAIKDAQENTSLTDEEKTEIISGYNQSLQEAQRLAFRPAVRDLGEILSPDQFVRFKQLGLQRELMMGGREGFDRLLNLTNRLKLTPDQAKTFEETVIEVHKEYEARLNELGGGPGDGTTADKAELANLRNRLEDKAIAALPPEARTRLDELIGRLQFDHLDR